ncbi:bifunctional 4-hydroxy-2-oxoglutarate aldolase/2-dehydro-3-deoxy-phosphogluconate aldolase [Streptomyces sp. NPDC002734]|uniref:bifunctional 4-hydroxy-2-oxoglutarate aldolase/2-dehydro-3-deoxy-phosphogluconate aldolase n=1 Tax=Streptomyces sp. NPDC002734 TaxID=3154426 RepID=UPI00331C0FC8
MDSGKWFDSAFDGRPLMAILRGFDPGRTVELARRAWDLGVEWVEVPVQGEDGVDALAAAVEAGRERDLGVAAGTVTTRERLRRSAAAGASFAVAPGLDPGVAEAALESGMPYLPGVATASEIQAAGRLGLRWLKVFPAAALGPQWFTAMRGPFPEARFVATGGVDAANARRFLDAGARVVGVGSALQDPAQLDLLTPLLPGRER